MTTTIEKTIIRRIFEDGMNAGRIELYRNLDKLATAIVAWYASFAEVTNSTFGRTVFPVRPLKR